MPSGSVLDARAEPLAAGVERLDHRLVAVRRHRGEPRSEPDMLRPVGRREEEHALAVVVEAAEPHDLAPPREGGEREPVRDALPPRRQVGRDAVHLLGSAVVPAESRDVLVEDEERSVGAEQLLEPLEEPLARRRRPLGLEHEAGDAPGMLLQQRLDRGEVVVVERQRLLGDVGRDPAPHGRDDHRPVVVGEERVVDA